MFFEVVRFVYCHLLLLYRNLAAIQITQKKEAALLTGGFPAKSLGISGFTKLSELECRELRSGYLIPLDLCSNFF